MNEGTRGSWKCGELVVGGFGITPSRLFSIAGIPTNGAAGTGAGRANPGSEVVDTTNGDRYVNVGTLASPIWTMLPRTVSLAITNAQAKAIRATPLTIVAAPGAGPVIVPISAYVGLIYGGTNAFTSAANDNLSLKLKDGSGAILMSGAVQAFLQAVNSAINFMVPGQAVGATVNVSKANGDNQPLVVHNQSAAEIAGNAAADNTLLVTVTYIKIASGL
jgi:hypothetical protein